MELTRGQRILVLVGLAAVLLGIIILSVSRLERAPGAAVAPVVQSAPAAPGEIVVHVVGAVRAPGVYRLRSGGRVGEAVGLAGGLCAEADPASVNLAAVAEDGQQIVVRAVPPVATLPAAEPVAPTASAPPPPSPQPQARPPQPVAVTPPQPAVPTVVSLNRASKPQLESLPGIGPELAQRILYYRYENGPFSTVDDLQKVEGIGRDRLEAVRPYLQP